MPRKELDNYVKVWYRERVMVDQITLANRVAARRERLEQELKASERVATAKVSRGNVYLLMGKYANGRNLGNELATVPISALCCELLSMSLVLMQK